MLKSLKFSIEPSACKMRAWCMRGFSVIQRGSVRQPEAAAGPRPLAPPETSPPQWYRQRHKVGRARSNHLPAIKARHEDWDSHYHHSCVRRRECLDLEPSRSHEAHVHSSPGLGNDALSASPWDCCCQYGYQQHKHFRQSSLSPKRLAYGWGHTQDAGVRCHHCVLLQACIMYCTLSINSKLLLHFMPNASLCSSASLSTCS
jgi:hypothetical protein